jgi:SAM-dependent methyltransferase
MPLTLRQLEFLASARAQPLLAMDLPSEPLPALTALRRVASADEASAILALRQLRRRAMEKFPPELAGGLLATDELLQQASSLRLATYKARRLAGQFRGAEAIDLCCGLGADSLALAAAGARVVAYDWAEAAAFCARCNARVAGLADRCEVRQADVTELDLPRDAVVHVDPDRRPAGRRRISVKDYSPDEAYLRGLPGRTMAGAMKLSPAMDYHALADWADVELEYVGELGQCRQLVVWWGLGGAASHDGAAPADRPAGRQTRRATVVFGDLADPRSVSLPAGLAGAAPVQPPGDWLIEPDPAVVAAGAVDDLAAQHGLWRFDRRIAWLFGHQPIDTPLAGSFRVLAVVPARIQRIRQAIRDADGGQVEVKPRGLRLDTDAAQRELRGHGHRPLAVLWCKTGHKQLAFLCERAG